MVCFFPLESKPTTYYVCVHPIGQKIVTCSQTPANIVLIPSITYSDESQKFFFTMEGGKNEYWGTRSICVLCDPRVFKLLELPKDGMDCLQK